MRQVKTKQKARTGQTMRQFVGIRNFLFWSVAPASNSLNLKDSIGGAGILAANGFLCITEK